MPRMKLTTDSCGHVTIEYDEESGERVTRQFTCPEAGGYVREFKGTSMPEQVCERLASRGVTLRAASRADLPRVIRREYEALRAYGTGESRPRGRPAGTGRPPEQRTMPRSVRLTDARWAKRKALGTEWLERQIDKAPNPSI